MIFFQSAVITHVLLDIEGTTCPVSFVANTLFPYASQHLEEYLCTHAEEQPIQALLQELDQLWREDPDPNAQRLRHEVEQRQQAGVHQPAIEPRNLVAYLQWLIALDRKVTPLKDLQGRIWQEGYARGDLQGPLFEDVAPALRAWASQGLVLAVYSSGSVQAQQLLYGHSNAGDCRSLFSHWFDTRAGKKQESSSYQRICELMQVAPPNVLFVSDAISELNAANAAGLKSVFSRRKENPEQDAGPYTWVPSLLSIKFSGQIES